MQPWLYYLVGTCNIAPGVDSSIIAWENIFNPFVNTAVADYYRVLTVPYSASLLDAGASIDEGINSLVGQIKSSSEPFILAGASQGATVISEVLRNHLQAGDLTARMPDMWQAFTFGNPERQATKTYPGGSDPGGHGVRLAQYRITNTPANWWEFAMPGDMIATNGDDSISQLATAIFEWISSQGSVTVGPTASVSDIQNETTTALQGLASLSAWTPAQIASTYQSLWAALTWTTPHMSYTDVPMPGGTLTAVQLAVNQAVAVAQSHGMLPPELRMDNVVSGPQADWYIVELAGIASLLSNDLYQDKRWATLTQLVGKISTEWTSNQTQALADANSLVALAGVMKASYPANANVDIMLRYAQALAGIWQSDILGQE
jgi:hypothetical protein